MPDFETLVAPYVRQRVDVDPGRCELPSEVGLGDDADGLDEPEPVREGLPPGYRMRHDRHYVETIYTREDEARAAEHRDDALLSVIRELAEALHAVGASASEIATRGRSLRERAAIALVCAETRRAAWLADAAATVAHDPSCTLDPVDLADVLRRVVSSLEPAQRITGLAPSLYVADGLSSVRGDGRLLEAAIGGMLVAMGAVVEDRGAEARLAIRLVHGHDDPSELTIEVTQGSVVLPARALARFFDEQFADHPAGRAGALHLAAAQRIARVHRARLGVDAVESGGCTLSFTIRGSA